MFGSTFKEQTQHFPFNNQPNYSGPQEIKSVTRRGRTSDNLYASIEPAKAMHWADLIDDILKVGQIGAKDAERLAGRLNFAAGAVAGRSGAARIS